MGRGGRLTNLDPNMSMEECRKWSLQVSLSVGSGIRNPLITLIPSKGVAIRSFSASYTDRRFCSSYLSVSYRHHHHQQH